MSTWHTEAVWEATAGQVSKTRCVSYTTRTQRTYSRVITSQTVILFEAGLPRQWPDVLSARSRKRWKGSPDEVGPKIPVLCTVSPTSCKAVRQEVWRRSHVGALCGTFVSAMQRLEKKSFVDHFLQIKEHSLHYHEKRCDRCAVCGIVSRLCWAQQAVLMPATCNVPHKNCAVCYLVLACGHLADISISIHAADWYSYFGTISVFCTQ